MRGLTAHVSAYEELAVDAALRGGRDRVYEAMLAHPLIGQYDQAEQLTDLLIAENAEFLPWAAAAGDRARRQRRPAAALAIDGGNSKTDVALVAPTARCSRPPGVRGPTPTSSGWTRPWRCSRTWPRPGRGRPAGSADGPAAGPPVAGHVSACLAGADLPEDEEQLAAALQRQGWAATCSVVNDTFAILRAGLVPDSAMRPRRTALAGRALRCGTGGWA